MHACCDVLGAKQPAPPDAEDNCGNYQPLLGGEF